ncbi:MAG: MarR family transcriptional regulator [archaeon]
MVTEQDKSPLDPNAVWPKYGLKESPYFTTAMRLLGIVPIENVFSGRAIEIIKFKRIITSSNSSRSVIVGNFGVGKTSFANFLRWSLCIEKGNKSKYLTTSAEIKIQPDWNALQFLLSTLTSIYTSSIIFDWKKQGINLKTINKLKDYVSITKHKGYQGNLWVVGGGYNPSSNSPPILSPEILENLLISVCKDLMESNKQLIIQYDNLENMELKSLAELFRSIRDYLQIEGFHTLFLGSPQVISALETYGQVHSVFSRPYILESLTESSVLEILKKRCEQLKSIRGNYIKPYDDNTVKEIYLKLNKNIRFTFKVLEDATVMSEASAPCEITIEDIKAVQEKEKTEILSKLTDTQLKIVSALIDRTQLNQRELSEITKIGITNLTTPVKELQDKGLIVIQQDEKDKRFKYVRLSDNSYLALFFTSKNKTSKVKET